MAFSGGPTGQTVLQVHSEAEFIVVSSVNTDKYKPLTDVSELRSEHGGSGVWQAIVTCEDVVRCLKWKAGNGESVHFFTKP